MYKVSLLSCPWIRRLSQGVPADEGFLCDKAAMSGGKKKGTLCIKQYWICAPFRKMCEVIPVRAVTLWISGYTLPFIHILITQWKWADRFATGRYNPGKQPCNLPGFETLMFHPVYQSLCSLRYHRGGKQSRNRPGVAKRVPGGLDSQISIIFGTWRWWGCQPHAPTAFTPRKCSWYSFSLGAESTPGPW